MTMGSPAGVWGLEVKGKPYKHMPSASILGNKRSSDSNRKEMTLAVLIVDTGR